MKSQQTCGKGMERPCKPALISFMAGPKGIQAVTCQLASFV